MKNLFYAILSISVLLIAVSISYYLLIFLPKNNLSISNKKTNNDNFDAIINKCIIPDLWEEIGFIFKDCQLEEIESGNNYNDMFAFNGGNGSHNYCNTLTFRKYKTINGDLYTYEKERYKHYPNSEAGEYKIPKLLYNEMTNSKKCQPTANRINTISDDDISSSSFPSRNMKIISFNPCYWASFFNRHYSEYGWKGEETISCPEY